MLCRKSMSGEVAQSAPNSPRKANAEHSNAKLVSQSPSLSRIGGGSHSPSPSPTRLYQSRERRMTSGSNTAPLSPSTHMSPLSPSLPTPVERRRDRYRQHSPSHGGLTVTSRMSVGTAFSAFSVGSADIMQSYLKTVCEAYENTDELIRILTDELIILPFNYNAFVFQHIVIKQVNNM